MKSVGNVNSIILKPNKFSALDFTGERIIPELPECDKKTRIFKQHKTRYDLACSFVDGGKVLDLGCGVGYGARMLARFADVVYAVDPDKEAVAYGSNYYGRQNIVYAHGDLFSIQFKDCFFDMIACFEVIEHMEHVEAMLGECRRILKPEGLFVLSTPNALRDNFEGNPFHSHEFTPSELRKLLRSAKFEIVREYGQYAFADTFMMRAIRKIANPLYQKMEYLLSRPEKMTDKCQNMVFVCRHN